MSPKIAGIESSANRMSVVPMASITTSIGVTYRLPSIFVKTLAPWYSSVTGSTRRISRSARFSW